jgi:hypothetical protein
MRPTPFLVAFALLAAFFGAAVLVTLDSFEAGFVFADFESTVLGSVTGFSRLAALVAFLTAGFTVLGTVFSEFGLLVPDVFFGLIVALATTFLATIGFNLLTGVLFVGTLFTGAAALATTFFDVAFTALGLAAGAFLTAALDVSIAAALAFGAFFGGLLAGGEVLFLVAVLGLVADLAFSLIVALATVAPAFLDFSAATFAFGALDAFAGVLAFTVFLGFAAIVDSNLLGHKKTGSKSSANVTRSSALRQASN